MDRLDGRILVKGWALDLLAPSGKATVRIRIGDHEFWTLADAALQDAPVSTLADGRFGFRFSLEAQGEAIPSVHFVDGSPLPRIASLPMGIATTPIRWPLSTSEQTGLTASLEFHNDIVRGWVREASSGLPVDIAVRVDGEIVWSGLATRLESSALDGSGSRTPHGFRLLLPRPLRPTMMRAIDIRAADGRVIPNGRFSVIDGATFRGSVEAAVPAKDGVTVRGWCLDLQRPLHPLRLNAVDAEGRVVGATVAQGDRPNLRSALQIDTPYGGFTLTLPPSGVVWPVQIIGEGSFRAVPPGAVVPQEAVDDATGAPVFATADDLVEGRVDKIWAHGIRGWAREKTGRAQVFVDLLMDGIWVATVAARSFRPDLARHFGDHGCHEFRFELTSSQAWQAPGQIVVRPRRAIGAIVAAKNIRLEGPLAPAKRHCLRHFANERRLLVTKPVTLNKVKAQQFAVIILNRDGAGLLDRLFQSFKDHSSYQKLEFIVVDHGSKDDSREVCHRWATEFEVNFFDRGGNHSFSNSNNYGVAKSAGDYVLFLNNDVRLSEDVLGSLARHLSCPEVGVVGIGLEDDVPAPGLEDPEGHRPIQHLGVHVALAPGPYAIHAFESRYSSEWEGLDRAAMRSPAVTGAVMAMRREVFEDLGGFDERYYYGYEDVDLCLRARQKGLDIVCLNGKRALHLRAYSRSQVGANYDDSQRRNRVLLDARFGSSLRRALACDRFSKAGFWAGRRLRVAFVVTKNDPATMAGDYFTATELARALAAEFPVECVFVEHDSDVLKHLVGVDALIAMRDDFDPRRIASHEPHMLRIAWVRNWFERFSQRPFVQDFDAIWASSRAGADIIATATGRMVDVVPIATNPSRFGNGLPQADLVSDYCFTGSFWGFNREIIQMLDPAALPYRFLLVGQGWENVPKLAPYSRGPLPYDRMADVYASSRLVIDDANHVTRETGSVNSRVFDALVAGCLVVTNGVRGSQEMFDGRLPTYSSPQELEGLLELYLENEQLRLDTVAELRETVLRHHTYGHRARICWKAFQDLSSRVRIALKIGAPRREDFQEWGDYHYAASLKRALERLGYMVGIDALKEWENQSANADDVVLVLRGLSAYMPKAHQVNLAWVISHPDSIADAELALFDHVFVASEPYAAELSQRLDRAVTPLLQCTDPELFHPDVRAAARKPSLLFVGNSRMELRPIVRDAIAAGLAPEVWGTRWHGLIPERYIMGANIPNRDLASHYRAAAVVLNDHWASMRRHGFISNRVFDVLACGGRLLSDPVEGLTSLFGSLVKTYENPSELATQVATLAAEDASHQAERDRAARQIGKAHSFDARAAIIAECIESHLQQRGRLHVA